MSATAELLNYICIYRKAAFQGSESCLCSARLCIAQVDEVFERFARAQVRKRRGDVRKRHGGIQVVIEGCVQNTLADAADHLVVRFRLIVAVAVDAEGMGGEAKG